MKRTIGILIIGLTLAFTSVYAGNPQKKSFTAKYSQCQVQLEKFQTVDKEIRALPANQVTQEMKKKKIEAWKEYKQCEKEAKKQRNQQRQETKDFNDMTPENQTDLQQQLDTVKKGKNKKK